MNERQLSEYRIEQLEDRMNRVEKFLLGAIISCALFSCTLMWLIIDIPNKIRTNPVSSMKAN